MPQTTTADANNTKQQSTLSQNTDTKKIYDVLIHVLQNKKSFKHQQMGNICRLIAEFVSWNPNFMSGGDRDDIECLIFMSSQLNLGCDKHFVQDINTTSFELSLVEAIKKMRSNKGLIMEFKLKFIRFWGADLDLYMYFEGLCAL